MAKMLLRTEATLLMRATSPYWIATFPSVQTTNALVRCVFSLSRSASSRFASNPAAAASVAICHVDSCVGACARRAATHAAVRRTRTMRTGSGLTRFLPSGMSGCAPEEERVLPVRRLAVRVDRQDEVGSGLHERVQIRTGLIVGS